MIESNKKTSMNTLSFMVLVLQIVLDTRTYTNRHYRLVSSCHETREPLTIEDMPTAYLIRVRIKVMVRNRLRVRFKDRVGLGLAVVASAVCQKTRLCCVGLLLSAVCSISLF